MELSGRSVFLTGGAQGIGRAVTAALLEKGAKVVFCDLIGDMGKETEEELQKKYGADNVTFVQCDVTNADQLEAAFQNAVKKFDAVEICVNNAGIMDQRNWEKMLAVNTTAQIRGSELAYEHMRRDKGGRGGVIVNTVSGAGLFHSYRFPVYVASKHAMIGYTTSRASDPDMPAHGVRWCCLCPMPVNTGMMRVKGREVKNPDEFRMLVEKYIIEPEDVAEAFLKQLQDVNSNGTMMLATKEGGIYCRRVLVGEDGVSNPQQIDQPLTNHPPVPGNN